MIHHAKQSPDTTMGNFSEANKRPFNTLINNTYQAPPPQLLSIRPHENRQNLMKLIPQNIRQIEGRHITAQHPMAVMRQPIHN